jgi:hypothetical protein
MFFDSRRLHQFGEREGVQELEAITIQDPKIAVPTRVCGRLRELPVDLRVNQERRRDSLSSFSPLSRSRPSGMN